MIWAVQTYVVWKVIPKSYWVLLGHSDGIQSTCLRKSWTNFMNGDQRWTRHISNQDKQKDRFSEKLKIIYFFYIYGNGAVLLSLCFHMVRKSIFYVSACKRFYKSLSSCFLFSLSFLWSLHTFLNIHPQSRSVQSRYDLVNVSRDLLQSNTVRALIWLEKKLWCSSIWRLTCFSRPHLDLHCSS